MITIEQFHQGVASIRHPPDEDQRTAIDVPASEGLFIVAGPGSGKTTCLTLRVLKMILVDGLAPTGIVATTFTKKAAEELRSRVLGWGFQLIDVLKEQKNISSNKRQELGEIDINQVWTGTLDSLCEEILRDNRIPGQQPPVLADEFVVKTLMLRRGLFEGRKDQDQQLNDFFSYLWGTNFGLHTSRKSELLSRLWERRHQDLVDWSSWVRNSPPGQLSARKLIDSALDSYKLELEKRNLVDFSTVEFEVLNRLNEGKLSSWLEGLEAILVDEYQDTNLLQEKIYFAIARSIGGSLTVVGDDDQSLYRFRGATVDLFRDFESRYRNVFKSKPVKVYLSINYRSSKSIVNFVNSFAKLDSGYQSVRVKGKPLMKFGPTASDGMPILGMFRNTQEELAEDLTNFVHKVFRGKGFKLSSGQVIVANKDLGDVGDCALLCSSPRESKETNNGAELCLPGLLRQNLLAKFPGITMFNPRGQDFHEIEIVMRFGGAMLRCLDLDRSVQDQIYLNDSTRSTLDDWRASYDSWVNENKAPSGLVRYVEHWGGRNPGRKGLSWPKGVACIDLLYALTHYFPKLHDESEGQVYLEVFTRQLTACQSTSGFKGNVVFDQSNPDLSRKSVRDLIADFLGPIASGEVSVEEEMIESFPRDQLSVLSIHQSKGLEFPMVIVDVGSEFKTNHQAHAFKRFPKNASMPHRLEDLVRSHSELSMTQRTGVDRAFDDLIRQYFVAYSRPQDVLLLVGLKTATVSGRIPNVAFGHDRTGIFHWSRITQTQMELI